MAEYSSFANRIDSDYLTRLRYKTHSCRLAYIDNTRHNSPSSSSSSSIIFSSLYQHSTAATDNWEEDPEGRPDSKATKGAKGLTKLGAKLAKTVAKSGLIDDKAASALEGAANFAENQANMDGSATLGDRLRMGGECFPMLLLS